jgi:hypothetical protein
MTCTASRICCTEGAKVSPCQSPTMTLLESRCRAEPAGRQMVERRRALAEDHRRSCCTGTTAEPTWSRSVWLAIVAISVIAS